MSELGSNWQIFPLYGLTITEDDGLTDPIFEAATLVSTEWAASMAQDATGQKETARMLSGATLVSELGADRLQHLEADPRHVVECHPHSYIAVRNRHHAEAEHHASRVRAMLSAAMVIRGGILKAFSPSPLSLAWSTVPMKIREDHGQLQAKVRIVANNHTFLRAETVTKSALRESWRTGRPIAQRGEGCWDISMKHGFAKILCGNSRAKTDLKKRIQAGAIQLSEASNSAYPLTQLQMSVAALEIMLGTNNFSRLEGIVEDFLPNTDDRRKFGRILTARHAFVHNGVFPKSDEIGRFVQEALLYGWAFLKVACEIAERRQSVKGFDGELEARLASRCLVKALDALRHGDERQEFRTILAAELIK